MNNILWQELTNNGMEEEFNKYFFNNYLVQHPELTIQSQTPIENPETFHPNPSTLKEAQLVDVISNWADHEIYTWNLIRTIDVGESSNTDKRAVSPTPETFCIEDSKIPQAVCSCTGVLRDCLKWGKGGWQSACCTENFSQYPLPKNPNRKYKRVMGRKIQAGRYKRIVTQLKYAGYDISNTIDLKDFWAKRGSNRYALII